MIKTTLTCKTSPLLSSSLPSSRPRRRAGLVAALATPQPPPSPAPSSSALAAPIPLHTSRNTYITHSLLPEAVVSLFFPSSARKEKERKRAPASCGSPPLSTPSRSVRPSRGQIPTPLPPLRALDRAGVRYYVRWPRLAPRARAKGAWRAGGAGARKGAAPFAHPAAPPCSN